MKRTAAVWALRYRKGGGHMFASGNWLAPWIFPTRERARKAAREARAHKQYVVAVKISLSISWTEIN